MPRMKDQEERNRMTISTNLFTEKSLKNVVKIVYRQGSKDYRFERCGRTNDWNYFEDHIGKRQSSPECTINAEILVQYLNRLLTSNLLTNSEDIYVKCEEDFAFNMMTKESYLDIDYICQKSFNALFGDLFRDFGFPFEEKKK